MIEIGTKCKINLSETEYKITDVRKKDITIKIDDDTTHQIIDYFVDLEEIENPKVTVKNLSITNINWNDV
ncbi:hypothetical protein ACFSX9_15990 [Flavobacterium ardleyense]|uniref:Uncharacterized protein n=1 Tax=Flavobacterium ardleyense TaxID=2038737 RepID=A0ABW5ZFJ2_9FLAO